MDLCFEKNSISVHLHWISNKRGTTTKFPETFFPPRYRYRLIASHTSAKAGMLVDTIDITTFDGGDFSQKRICARTFPLNILWTTIRRIEWSLVSGDENSSRIAFSSLKGKIIFLLLALHQCQILARSLAVLCFSSLAVTGDCSWYR